MKYPKMNKQPRRIVGVPSLQGGVNFRDALNMCADNQLTDSSNVWFRDGVLKTRNGRVNLLNFKHASTPNDANISWTEREDKHHLHEDVIKVVNGVTYKLVSYLTSFKNYVETSIDGTKYEKENYSRLILFWVDENGNAVEKGEGYGQKFYKDKITNYFVTATSKGIYLFLQTSAGNEIHKYNESSEEFEEISDEEIYAPIVITNGLMGSGVYDYSGITFEGENLLGRRSRFLYSTVNRGVTDDGSHLMIYVLPVANGKTVKKVVVELTGGKVMFDSNEVAETVEHTVVIGENSGDVRPDLQGGDWYQELESAGDRLWMSVVPMENNLLQIGFSRSLENSKWTNDDTNNNGSTWAKIPAGAEKIENNLEITVYYDEDNENAKKFFSMTKAESFGGASEGLSGGTRLFLGGNIEETEKSLVIWSGLNEPLYFPENCYSYVGNSLSAVKGFGKQEDMLVIFKENELYYTKYTQNNSITAESLINQSVVDYAASSVYFPLVQINAAIGCLSADTVKLCRNRLVWLGQDNKVYTLTGASQYSERNVFCVSEMIDHRLRTESELKDAYALDFDGHYMLITGGRAYLMDYNSYGYQYVYSYQKAEDANIKIPWYVWEDISDKHSILFNINDRLCGITYKYALEPSMTSHSASKLELFNFTGDTDDGKAIKSMVQTKFFDFGQPNYRKNIETVGVSLGNNGGEPITVKFITEAGEDCTTIALYDDDTDSRSAGYIKSRILYPSIRSAVRFGVRFECEGDMAIEGLNITYRTLGGAR